MALTGKGRFYKFDRSRNVVYVPSNVVKDSQWPLAEGEAVSITVDPAKRRVIIEPLADASKRSAPKDRGRTTP